jgi:putative endopeptidase
MTHLMKSVFHFLLIFFIAASCMQSDSSRESFVDVAGIDPSTKPGDDFFRHVNGKWYDTARIADDQVGVGSYRFLNIPQRLLLQNILDSISAGKFPSGSIEQKVGDFYASGMDTITIEQRGVQPVLPTLERIDQISDIPSLVKFVAAEMTVRNGSMINFDIWPDDHNSSMNIAHMSQTGIGLPERDYYFKTDSSTVGIQRAYQMYIAMLFRLSNTEGAKAESNARIAYRIEEQLASAHKTNIELRDVKANYNRLPVTTLDKRHPNINWTNVLTVLGANTDSLDIAQLSYYDKLNEMLKSVSLQDWKIYLKACSLRNYADLLSKPFVDAAFEFNKALSGQAKQKKRAQIVTANVDGLLGDALGQLYVKKYFNEEARRRASELVSNLQKSFESRINQLDWMSDSTKQKAKEKLYAITKKIGYPEKWRDYESVKIDRSKYFENMVALRRNAYQFELSRLDKPVDRTEWGVTPSTVTAYYNPYNNEIVIPAGILQYPYFDAQADDAINYGGIGMVIGHELTHAFDDQGGQFDKNGNVKNWWTKEDFEKFKSKAQQMIERYSSFTVLDSVPIKGALTVGENIADNGGVAVAYDAFKLTEQGKNTTKIDGYTPDQRFFLSVARIWRVKTRDEFLRNYVATDPHSPAAWRVNGSLMNFTPFYVAFNVQPGEKNFKEESERIRIW